jgi:hypothetical protein
MSGSSIVWQQRRQSALPVSIRNGLEHAWSGSTAALIDSAHSVTLLTRSGSEVIVGDLRPLTDGWWKGAIMKFAPDAGHLKLGDDVRFHEDNVLGATI